MNKKPTNEGGYEKSDLKKWIDSYLYNSFPLELKTRMLELTIPTVGQVVGWENEWDKEHFEADDDEQLPLIRRLYSASAEHKFLTSTSKHLWRVHTPC